MVAAVSAACAASDSLLAAMAVGPERGFAVSVPYLKLCGLVIGGWLMARSADIAAGLLESGDTDREFLTAKLATARFYADQILPQVGGLQRIVQHGAASVLEVDAALL